MKSNIFLKKTLNWLLNNIVAVILVTCFISIFIISQINSRVFEILGSTSIGFLNHQYYRWITSIFLHFDFIHIFFNSLALLAISSLLSPFIGKLKTFIIFICGGVLAEIAFSFIMSYTNPIYGGGSSGGIFSLIACFVVCYLRFPNKFDIKIYRIDLIIVIVYFVFANINMSSFLTHAFSFIAGIIISFIMVLCRIIRDKEKTTTIEE